MALIDTRPAPGAVPVRQPLLARWRHLDLVLIGAVLLIAAFGCLMIYTATRVELETAGLSAWYTARKQIIYDLIGVVLMLVVARIDYRRWRDWAPALYGLSVLMLLAVFVVGRRVKGAQAWFQVGPFQFEPSEFAKIALILALAAFAARYRGKLPGRAILTILGLAVVPFALVYKQPDLGSALVLMAVLIVELVIAGARLRHVGILTLVGVLAVTAVLETGMLKAYQTARLTSFLNTPNKVSQAILSTDAGANIYNLVQSKDAISNGGLLGRGIGKGTATNLSQVPEQQTDFIFSAAGEQVGLVGCALLLGLFLLVMWRTWRTAGESRDLFGALICVGVLAMLLFQTFENVGMAMGIMPVAGIPLPWMSYGGSAVLVEFVAIGLVQSVRLRRYP